MRGDSKGKQASAYATHGSFRNLFRDSPPAHNLVVLHKSLAIDLRRAYDLRYVCDHFSPQRGSDMSALRHEGVGKEEEKKVTYF